MTLYIVPTPIGNLEDITLRALRILKQVDLIVCEDTRVSSRLLKNYGVSTPLKSYHKFNEKSLQEPLIEKLRNGLSIGLISSAGTPVICDPGQRLVQAAIDAKFSICPLPGPSATITALVATGFPIEPFQFWGFLERRGKRQFLEILNYNGTSVCYESPKRILKSLLAFGDLEKKATLPVRSMALVKELTKIHERVFRGTALELFEQMNTSQHLLKGEWVIVIAPPNRVDKNQSVELDPLEIQKLWNSRRPKNQSRKDFVDQLATKLKTKKQTVIRALLLAD